MTWYVGFDGADYTDALATFDWDLPDRYNAAADLLQKHADPKGRIALRQAYADGRRESYSFWDFDVLTNRLANSFRERGISRGDTVGVMVPQKPANLLVHLACWKIGAVSMPLSVLFGTDAVRYRIQDAGASAVVVDESFVETVETVLDDCPTLDFAVQVDGEETAGFQAFENLLASGSRRFDIVDTSIDDPAVLLYTSGSTGDPKGVLHTQGVWLGQCPAYAMYYGQGDVETNFVENGVVWGHADWAWIGTLGFTVFPAWHYGRPVVGYPMEGFDPACSLALLEEFGVTHAMFVPTAMRMLMASEVSPDAYDLDLEVIMSGSEPVTPEIQSWVAKAFDGVTLNEIYGQTELTAPIGNCTAWFEPRAGSMGKPVPGSHVSIRDPKTGDELGVDELGEICVRRDEAHPGIFREYLGDQAATARTSRDGWHQTGDLARVDEDGYYWYEARVDDLIITSGYRVSPAEVESAILDHEAVEQVGVVGVPDERRGEIIKAFVQTRASDTESLEHEIESHVRAHVAEYEYPREVEFVEQLPQTVTGKIKRRELRDRDESN